LSPQELRHAAYTGEFLTFVENAAAQSVLGELGVFTPKDYLRRRNDEFMAEVAYALTSRAYPNKKEGLDELFLGYERHGVPDGVLDELAARCGRVFQQLEPMAGALRRTRFRNKSDFYTLFLVLAKSAELLPLQEAGTDRLKMRLQEFATLVNDIKREEGEEKPEDSLWTEGLGQSASRYLRAVERAASDRLSRVRRDEELQAAISPILAEGTPRDFSTTDRAWLENPTVEDIEDDEVDVDVEQAHARDVLTHAED
jgi:hypothetical protein